MARYDELPGSPNRGRFGAWCHSFECIGPQYRLDGHLYWGQSGDGDWKGYDGLHAGWHDLPEHTHHSGSSAASLDLGPRVRARIGCRCG